MQFNIEIINVQATTKPTKNGSYVQLDVAYKRLDNGKVEGKKIMSFANKDAYAVLSKANQGAQFTITSEKDGDYWQWVAVTPLSGTTGEASPTKAPGFASPKSTYETPEERAKRQVLIVRQSSLSAAIATLKTDKKELDPQTVIELAERYNAWVFQEKLPDLNFADMADDIPM